MIDIHEKLQAAFRIESREHLDGMRSLLEKWPDSADTESITEIFRRAHSLKGAARAVGLRDVEEIAHRLESIFDQMRAGELLPDPAIVNTVRSALDGIEEILVADGRKDRPAAPANAGAIRESSASALDTSPAESEGVRIRTESLDQFLVSAERVLDETRGNLSLGRDLAAMDRRIREINRTWQEIRSNAVRAFEYRAGGNLAAELQKSMKIAGADWENVARDLRGLRIRQKADAWNMAQAGRQFEKDLLEARMVPIRSIFEGFARMVRELAAQERKEIAFKAEGLDSAADRAVLQELKDPVMHLLRNAVSHGIEPPDERRRIGKPEAGTIAMRFRAVSGRLIVEISDDGRGIEPQVLAAEAARRGVVMPEGASSDQIVRLIFQPGFSTASRVTKVSGRGMGLSVVQEAARRLHGECGVRHEEEWGTTFTISTPLTVSTHGLMVVDVANQSFAIPIASVERVFRTRVEAIKTVEGRPVIDRDGLPLSLSSLAQRLGISEAAADSPWMTILILRTESRRIALKVSRIREVLEGVIRNPRTPQPLPAVIAGATVLADRSICLVLSPASLVESENEVVAMDEFRPAARAQRASILVVDDSITTRTLEKSILETKGYTVHVAIDGVAALEMLETTKVDLVVTDLQMPRLDGFGLLERLKRDHRFARLPVIVVTSLEKQDDRERGMKLGADAYIMKRKFDQRELLETIEQLI